MPTRSWTYALVDTPRGILVLGADTLVEKCLARYGSSTGTCDRHHQAARQLGGLNFKPPACTMRTKDTTGAIARLAPVYLADYVSDTDGTGIVHSSRRPTAWTTSTAAWRTA
jgi:isoleucyl-tRNA synthetase